jgi:hypothetical protein
MAVSFDRASSSVASPPRRNVSKRVQSRYVISIMQFYFAFERPAGALSSAFTLPPSFPENPIGQKVGRILLRRTSCMKQTTEHFVGGGAGELLPSYYATERQECSVAIRIAERKTLGATDRTDTSQLGWTSINKSSAPACPRGVESQFHTPSSCKVPFTSLDRTKAWSRATTRICHAVRRKPWTT